MLDGPANSFLRLAGQPRFIYGTAWKKFKTSALVLEALTSGFRAVDTACQPKHYQEDLVGAGLRSAFQNRICARQDIFLQTKFTPLQGQDRNNVPYDETAPLEQQVRQSIDVSLHNFRPGGELESFKDSYIDCLLLHSPIHPLQGTLQAWTVLESYVPNRIRSLGISNVSLDELKILFEAATVKPKVVQNRFYGRTGYDAALRAFCKENDIVYESFWTLTGNPGLLKSAPVADLASEANVEREQALYALVMSLGIAVLNGTTNARRMQGDLRNIKSVDSWAKSNEEKWKALQSAFEKLLR